MARLKVSPKYQVVIPRGILESIKLKPGDEVEILEIDGTIEIVRVRPIKELRGSLKGMNTTGLREKRDRL